MKDHSQSDINRSISNLFAVPAFKDIFLSGYSSEFVEKISKFRSSIGVKKNTVIGKAISKAYLHLTDHYRNEYVYKNTIANKILLERHSLKEAGLINEMRIGESIADITVINGTNTIYEIKTELDNADKLQKQLNDYRKVSPRIYLVTHHTLVGKYQQIIEREGVGLISYSQEHQLETVTEATIDGTYLENRMMMSILRKNEYTAIIEDYFGYLPDVSNIYLYRECQRLASEIPRQEFHKMMLSHLQRRILKEKELISSAFTPFELKHICLAHNPSKQEINNLNSFLKLTL